MNYRKELKIEAKQALENWSQTFQQINQYPDEEIPQGKFDEYINLAIHSCGDISDVLERIIQLMQDNDQEAEAKDIIDLREELQTALKEALHFRTQNSEYTRNQLFSGLGNLDELMSVNDLFNQSDLEETNLLQDDSGRFSAEDISGEVHFHEFNTIEEDISSAGNIDLDDYLFDEE